jgi:hypothetical protein
VFVEVYVDDGTVESSITGGALRSVSAADAVLLDASGSYDDSVNVAGGETSVLQYAWSCVQTSPVLLDCDLSKTATNQMVLTVPANTFDSSSVYDLSVTVSNLVSTSKSSVTIRTAAAAVTIPRLDLSVPGSYVAGGLVFVNENEQVVVLSTITYASKFSSTWSALNTNDEMATLNRTAITSGGTYFPFRIAPTYLNGDITYIFELKVDPYDCANCAPSTAQMRLYVNPSPVFGVFVVSPSSGVAGLSGTNFTLSAALCTDDNIPLSYSFSYVSASGAGIVIHAYSEFSSLGSYLPAGQLDDGEYILTLTATAFDVLGAASSRSTTAIVSPHLEATVDTFISGINTGIDEAVLLQDYTLLLQRTASAGYQIEEYLLSNSQASDGTSEEKIANLTESLMETLNDNFQKIEFSENEQAVDSAIEVCVVYAGSSIVQGGIYDGAITSAIAYSISVEDMYSNIDNKELSSGLSLLECLSLLNNASSGIANNGRRRM